MSEAWADRSMMLAFEGTQLPRRVRSMLAERPVAGFTLFDGQNVANPGQVRRLTEEIQRAAGWAGGPPVLIAMDQEGGQLMALGEGSTPFPGNMALGATGDPDLAERVGRAIGRELRAVGVNVNYAPVCDVATEPSNPSLGVRSFGEDPSMVALLAAAMTRGFQAEGVAATLKHFPGKGEAAIDPHHELPVLDMDLERLRAVELEPFGAGIRAGAKVVMVGHYGLPRVTGRADLPTSLSRRVVDGLLRDELGFDGVVITDALDMKALPQGAGQAIDAIAALRAGADLLLCTADVEAEERIRGAVALGAARELLELESLDRSASRVAALRRWVGRFEALDPEVVGCAEHLALAREVAGRSVTLVRDDTGLLPLRLGADARMAAVMPRPRDLTPADTSSRVTPSLAAALRRHHPNVDEFLTTFDPSPSEISDLRSRAAGYDLVVLGTIAAPMHRGQSELANEVLSTGAPTVTVALRTPYDLASYPASPTHVCAYSIVAPTMDAVADALWGEIPFRGRLPAAIPGLYPVGHGLGSP